MAIDIQRGRELLKQIDALFDSELIAGLPIPGETIAWVKEHVLGRAFKELRELVVESRPPCFYLVGRSGHGKSSLINALVGKTVAEVGHGGDPQTPGAEPFDVPFPGRHASMRLYDSRGLFESKRPEKAATKDAVAFAREEILKYNPDIILHVLAIAEARAAAEDVKTVRGLLSDVQQKGKGTKPIVAVLTKADTLGKRTEWPPERHPGKAQVIADYVRVMADHVSGASGHKPIEGNELTWGCEVHGDGSYLYALPANVPDEQEERWNLETLLNVLGKQLPYGAKLQFFQALQRKEQLRQMSSEFIWKIAGLAGAVGLAPVPFADAIILIPLQVLMIAVVGGLSCQEPSLDTATKYLAACGGVAGGGFAAREGFRALLKFVPVAGNVLAGGVAAAATYALGKSAEAFFFAGEKRGPDEFKEQYRPSSGPTDGGGGDQGPSPRAQGEEPKKGGSGLVEWVNKWWKRP